MSRALVSSAGFGALLQLARRCELSAARSGDWRLSVRCAARCLHRPFWLLIPSDVAQRALIGGYGAYYAVRRAKYFSNNF